MSTPSPADARTEALLPCPFCGGAAEFERMGDGRQSCIVNCTDCGARHESGDAGACSGSAWNRRASSSPAARADAEAVAVRLKALAREASIDQRFSMSDKLHAIAAQVRTLGRGEAGLRGLVKEWAEATANYKHAATHADDYGEEEMADLRARCRNAEAALAAGAEHGH